MIVLVGKSGCGKTTLEREVQKKGYKKIVSYTTRPIRKNEGEIDGTHYNFITEEKFKKLKSEGFFAETAKYDENYYGAAKKDCKRDTVLIVEKDALLQLNKLNDSSITTFYIDVDLHTRYKRMKNRGDKLRKILSRLHIDSKLFDEIEKHVDFVVQNDSLKEAVEKIINLTEQKDRGLYIL